MTQKRAAVAGHICLDLIPSLTESVSGLEDLLVPGKLVNAGPVVVSTGGAVSNTGIALHRLGLQTTLMGKVGDDIFGRAILDVLSRIDDSLARGMTVAPGEASSYTVVINPPGVDRVFLHCPGANDTFSAEDIDLAKVDAVDLFHFGYPPLMKRMYADEGAELAAMLESVKKTGATVSLDMARPDPASPAGQADWIKILERALAFTDIYLPSLDETLFMLDRDRFNALERTGDIAQNADGRLLNDLAEKLLSMGPAIVALKLGDQGLYVRTSDSLEGISAIGKAAPPNAQSWTGRELLAPCFKTNVVGTTGAGDCTIAGFLAAVLKGLGPEQAACAAVAVGACNVESADATSGIRPWDAVMSLFPADAEKLPLSIQLDKWRHDDACGIWVSSSDSA